MEEDTYNIPSIYYHTITIESRYIFLYIQIIFLFVVGFRVPRRNLVPLAGQGVRQRSAQQEGRQVLRDSTISYT